MLVRTNAQLPVIEEAFRLAGIPFRSRGGGRLLDQPEIRDTLGAMRRGRRAPRRTPRRGRVPARTDEHGRGRRGVHRRARRQRGRAGPPRPRVPRPRRRRHLGQLPGLAQLHPRQRRRRTGDRRRRPRHVPRGQGPRVGRRAPRRPRGGARPDPPRADRTGVGPRNAGSSTWRSPAPSASSTAPGPSGGPSAAVR